MNYSIIKYVLGYVFQFVALFMLLPCLVALGYQETDGFYFLVCAACTLLIGAALSHKKPQNRKFYAREGIVVVALSWVCLSVIGAIPYVATGSITNFTDALFETVSGFTTTGASILYEVEVLPHCVLFWRCFTNWIGGMGVLVFIMAVLPYLGASNLYLMRAESTGPSVGKLVPKMQQTAFWLYGMYIGLTILEIILLICGGMPVFDAICDSLATAGTGGFAVRTDSIGSYSTYVQIVVTIFMFLFGVNFKFYFLILSRKVREAFHLEEIRWYFCIYIVMVLAITADICTDIGDLAISLRDSAFQVSSILTSTGFATVDFGQWSGFSQTLLVIAMCIGACAGSTGGGIKVSRILIYVKSIKKEIEYQIHPRSVRKIKVDGKMVDHEVLRSTKAFLIIYIMLAVGSMVIISLDRFDLVTNFTAVIASLSNIGPGLGVVGPSGNFAEFSVISKFVLMFDMLAGRLELIPMLLLFSPETWKKM
ncbi:MAG: TrkH family potassium uptake protein [Lachnospiraceae bacterium]|nr:TrkH family potassium uptake protein [Lachnospiraceae bacterium]